MANGGRNWHVEGVFAAVFLVLLLAAMTVQVVMRSGFGMTISWLEEVIRLIFVWTVYACILVAAVDDKHIRVAQHLKLFSDPVRKIIMGIADICWVAFNCVVVYGATVYSLSLIEFPYRMPTTQLNLVWAFSIIPIAFSILSIRVLVNIHRRWTGAIDMTDAQQEM